MEEWTDAEVLDTVRWHRGAGKEWPQSLPYRRRHLKALKAECRRRGLVRECRAARPRFPRAGA